MTAGLGDPAYVRAVVEAAAWHTRLTELSLDGSEEHELWLSTDPLHRRAWRETQVGWDLIGEVSAAPDIIALREAALARARTRSYPPRRVSVMVAAAAMLLLVIGLADLRPFSGPSIQRYQTLRGERRVVALADGSKIALDAGTIVDVAFSGHHRDLTLEAGQARFDVAHDTTRPFVVSAGDRAIIATGTSFNVDLLGPHVRVTLLEGRVVVRDTFPRGSPAPEVVLKPGDQLDSRVGSATALVSVSPGSATAWESGRLVIDDEPLADVAARVSRYTDEPVVVDPSVGDLKISGVFRSGDLRAFVDAVSSYLPLTSGPRAHGGVRLSRTVQPVR